MPGGVNSPVRAFKSVGGQPIVFDRVKGSHAWDVDGNEYVDYVGTWGPAIIGHADDEVSRCAFFERDPLCLRTERVGMPLVQGGKGTGKLQGHSLTMRQYSCSTEHPPHREHSLKHSFSESNRTLGRARAERI